MTPDGVLFLTPFYTNIHFYFILNQKGILEQTSRKCVSTLRTGFFLFSNIFQVWFGVYFEKKILQQGALRNVLPITGGK